MNRLELAYALLLLFVGAGAVGCASDNDSTVTKKETSVSHQPSADPLGVYEDDWGAAHRIDDLTWVIGSDVFEFVDFDPKADSAVAMNGAENQFFAGKYSRFDWATDEDGQLRYCQTTYDAKTAEAASLANRADESDWDSGCGGFPWSVLSGPSILGRYLDDYQGTHEISATAWKIGGQGTSLFHLLKLSNTQQYIVAENDTENSFSPGKYSRFDWYASTSDGLYYCQTAYQAETEAEAEATTPADPTELATGCGGFPWSKLVQLVP